MADRKRRARRRARPRQAVQTERYNIKDKLAYEMRKAMKLLALDEERAIIRNKRKVTGNATTPRKMAGLKYYIQTNVLDNKGTPRSYLRPSE